MQILPALLAAAVAVASTPTDLKRSQPVLVRAVINGDTIDVSTYGRVRLLGVDVPETGRGLVTPLGKQARDRLIALVFHRWIRLEQEGVAVDVYNRHLAYVVREDGLFVNAALVRDGLARVSARLPLLRLADLQRAEAEARAYRRGLWAATPQPPPPSYTRRSDGADTPTASRKKPRTTPDRRTSRRSNKPKGA